MTETIKHFEIDNQLITNIYMVLLSETVTPQEGFIVAMCVAHMIWKQHHDGSGKSFHACVNEVVNQLGARLQ